MSILGGAVAISFCIVLIAAAGLVVSTILMTFEDTETYREIDKRISEKLKRRRR